MDEFIFPTIAQTVRTFTTALDSGTGQRPSALGAWRIWLRIEQLEKV